MKKQPSIKSEQQIIRHWTGDVDAPVVSICCITYNHKDYISEAIDSFLMQETDFPFEILIHDDASTDGTTDIVRDYASRYPNLIRTVIQTENQYSQRPIIAPRFLFPIARGKYIAMCEGDDFWCHPKKLELQYQALEEMPAVNLCFHPAIGQTVEGQRDKMLCAHSPHRRLFPAETIIEEGPLFICTASIFFRTTVKSDVIACTRHAPVGDIFLQIVASLSGGALFLPDVMSVYRLCAPGAYTAARRNKVFSKEEIVQQLGRYKMAFDSVRKLASCEQRRALDTLWAQVQLTRAIFALRANELGLYVDLISGIRDARKLLPFRQRLFYWGRHAPRLMYAIARLWRKCRIFLNP